LHGFLTKGWPSHCRPHLFAGCPLPLTSPGVVPSRTEPVRRLVFVGPFLRSFAFPFFLPLFFPPFRRRISLGPRGPFITFCPRLAFSCEKLLSCRFGSPLRDTGQVLLSFFLLFFSRHSFFSSLLFVSPEMLPAFSEPSLCHSVFLHDFAASSVLPWNGRDRFPATRLWPPGSVSPTEGLWAPCDTSFDLIRVSPSCVFLVCFTLFCLTPLFATADSI